jgi:hypothetical protein
MARAAESTIRTAQSRAGYFGKTSLMCQMAQIPLSTFNVRIKRGGWRDTELRRLDRVIHFTDNEIIQLIRG